MKSFPALLSFLLLAAPLCKAGEPLPATPPVLKPAAATEPLPGTELLIHEGDLSRDLVDANSRFLDRQLEKMRDARSKQHTAGFDRHDRQSKFTELIGYNHIFAEEDHEMIDYDSEGFGLQYIDGETSPAALIDLGTEAGKISIHRVSWPLGEGLHGRGFLIEPGKYWTQVIAIPDTSQEPHELFWPGKPENMNPQTAPYALGLAMAGARVFVPTRIRRFETRFTLTDREWLARPAFELGRTLIAYELHKLASLKVAALDHATDKRFQGERPGQMKWNVIGWGDGGMLALYAGAIRSFEPYQTIAVSGYFGNRDSLWKEPFDHHIFGLLSEFGDAEIASLVWPGRLIIENSRQPNFRYRAKENSRELDFRTQYTKSKGKPGVSSQSSAEEIKSELIRLQEALGDHGMNRVEWSDANGTPVSNKTLAQFLLRAGRDDIEVADVDVAAALDSVQEGLDEREKKFASWILNTPDLGGGVMTELQEEKLYLAVYAPLTVSEETRLTEIGEIERHIQAGLVTAAAKRKAYFKDLKTDSLENFERTVEPYREKFRTEVIGDFEIPLSDPGPRTRPLQETDHTISFEVVLDVFDEVFAYGILTLPKSLPLDGSEKRPVVVCQHGLEGTPQDLVGEPKFKAYKAFATRLAERGFVTFAPQNGYKYFDHFRMQQFKAQSMGKTLFSIIVPQHEQITKWLAGQPFIDGEKIAFYGLSYGGKSAMRIPPLVDRYCLSICSADFNEWVWKNAATDEASLRYSYANKGEYEIFEWNLGGTFNYAEMASLICPRPFMVERGHFDGVAPDEKVGYEFAKVRHLYQAKLGIGDRCEIEWFPGPHTINGVGTFDFLHRHLDWPEP